MKRFLSLLALIACASLISSQEMAVGDLNDYIAKSMETLKMIDTLTKSIKPFDQSIVNSSDNLIAQLTTFYAKLNQVGSPGFAYAFQDSILELQNAQNSVYSTYKSIGNVKDYYNNYIYYLLMQKNLDCTFTLNNASQSIITAYESLRTFFQYQYIGNPDTLKSQFVSKCDGGVCDAALRQILATLNGDFTQAGCDVLQEVYYGLIDTSFYQGYRDLVVNTGAYIFNMALIGISVQSGYYSIANNNTEGWLLVQAQYLKQLETGLNRILKFNQMAKDNAIWSAERNLQAFLAENITANMTYQNVSDNVQAFLTEAFPNHFWFVYSYQNVQGQNLHSWRCSNCFASLNVQNLYHVLVAAIPRSSVANSNLVTNATIFDNTINSYQTANALVEGWYNNNCVLGVFATVYGTQGAYALADFSGIRLLSGTNKYKANAAIWAVNGLCPSQDTVSAEQ